MEKIDEEIKELREIATKLYQLHHTSEADGICSIVIELREKFRSNTYDAGPD